MKKLTLLSLSIFMLAFSCENDGTPSSQCISGKIVGQKCDIYALQLAEKILNATEWSKKNLITGEIEATYPNVIGLLNLPEEYKVDGQTVFITLREPTKEEKQISCYADMPPPPSPLYFVISANKLECVST